MLDTLYRRGVSKMSKKRRDHGSAFKTKVAIAAIKEELTQAQLTSHFSIHTTQLRNWKSQALESIQDGFSKKRDSGNACPVL